MAFIKAQRIIRDENGTIQSGSAAIIDTVYVPGEQFHSKQQVRERLGKIISLAEDGKSGLFMSPTRGFVAYDARSDTFAPIERDDPRVESVSGVYPQTEIHTVFGDSYLLLKFLEKSGLISILKSVFSQKEDYERVLAHVVHGIMRNGSRITCDNFIAKSFASYVLDDIPISTLRTDTAFFSMMGNDPVKMAFFITFIEAMRKTNPDFGRGCYVDSTPLPNDIDDNPFDALCCHGVSSSMVQMRLILVLDEETGLPVWYDIIPGNVLDLSTIMNVLNDIGDNLNIHVHSLVLDAGYASKELVIAFHIGTDKTIICRMPARKGYPFKTLYDQMRTLIGKGKYAFVRKRHTYFGHRKRIDLFGYPMYAYVYVDQQNALQRFRDYLIEHQDEYDAMKNTEKDWYTVKFGYFVLISNLDLTPAELLTAYFERTEIESVFKASKEYLGLLPLRKWTDQTVRGKILHDTINTIVLLDMRKQFLDSGISINEISGKTQSLMCRRDNHGRVYVETPNKKTKEYYNLMDVQIPSMVRVDQFKNKILGMTKM
jgi:hypothetical protein